MPIAKHELDLLHNYAVNKKFIMETGGAERALYIWLMCHKCLVPLWSMLE